MLKHIGNILLPDMNEVVLDTVVELGVIEEVDVAVVEVVDELVVVEPGHVLQDLAQLAIIHSDVH